MHSTVYFNIYSFLLLSHATEPNTGGNHRRKRSLYYPGSGFFSKSRGNSGFRVIIWLAEKKGGEDSVRN